ncbi:MAG TPA: GNAT family N-acetyltransferase [Candidatus Nanoarchaeia archaeon]|nr:GNAT family N-acetyltransferase [Candidatus Nanoarchaeia archaeon]
MKDVRGNLQARVLQGASRSPSGDVDEIVESILNSQNGNGADSASYILRPARASDVSYLYPHMQKEFFWTERIGPKGSVVPRGTIKPFTREEFEESIDLGQVMIIEQYSLAVATMSLLPRVHQNGRVEYEVARTYTHPNFRSQGFMQALEGTLAERALQLGAIELIATSRGQALDVFKKLGYSERQMSGERAELVCGDCMLRQICPELGYETHLYKPLTPSPNGHKP